VSTFVFQGTVGWVFGAFIVCFVSAFDCFKEFGFIFREPVRTVSFSSLLEIEGCFFYDFGEDIKRLPFGFGFSKRRASMDSVKLTHFFGHARNCHWSHFLCFIFLHLRIVCGSLSTSSTAAWFESMPWYHLFASCTSLCASSWTNQWSSWRHTP
jgi:hypothetical protein